MIGRLRFYRRRFVLPFAAVACLVFINGTALQPFMLPPELLEGIAAASAVTIADGQVDASSRPLQYERGADDAPACVGLAGPPPIVKNLRRPAPSRHLRTAGRGAERLLAASATPRTGLVQRGLVTHTADLSRLCRLLI